MSTPQFSSSSQPPTTTTTSTSTSTSVVPTEVTGVTPASTLLSQIPRSVHREYLQQTIRLASKSPPKPTNFRVGCVIVSFSPADASHDQRQHQSATAAAAAAAPSASSPSTPSFSSTPLKGTVLATGYTLELPGNTHAEQCALAKLVAVRRGGSSSSSINVVNESVTRPTIDSTDQIPNPNSDIGIDIDANAPLDQLADLFHPHENTILYTSLEPCSIRLSGSIPCVQRIIATTARRQLPPPQSASASASSPSPSSLNQNPNPEPKLGIQKIIFGAKEPGTFVRDSQTCQILDRAQVAWEYLPDFESDILKVAMTGHVNPNHNPNNTNSVSSISSSTSPSTASTAQAAAQNQTPPPHQASPAKETDTDTDASTAASTEADATTMTNEEKKKQEAESQPRNPKKRMMEYIPGT